MGSACPNGKISKEILQGAAMERIETFLETFLRKLAPNETQIAQTTNGRASNGHSSNGQALNGQVSNGHSSSGQASNGQASNGHSSNGQASNGHASNGQASNGLQTVNGSKVAPEVHRRPQAYSPMPPARHKQHQS